MRDVRPHDHHRSLKHLRPAVPRQHMVEPTQLRIDLKADVAHHLEINFSLSEENVSQAALSRHIQFHVSKVLDSIVQDSSLKWEHNEKQFQSGVTLLQIRQFLLDPTQSIIHVSGGAQLDLGRGWENFAIHLNSIFSTDLNETSNNLLELFLPQIGQIQNTPIVHGHATDVRTVSIHIPFARIVLLDFDDDSFLTTFRLVFDIWRIQDATGQIGPRRDE